MYAPLTIAAAWILQGIQVADIPISFSSVTDMADRFLAPILEEFRAGLAQDMVVKPGDPTPEGPVSIMFVDGDGYFCDRVYSTKTQKCVHMPTCLVASCW